jgi:hypothetical protein
LGRIRRRGCGAAAEEEKGAGEAGLTARGLAEAGTKGRAPRARAAAVQSGTGATRGKAANVALCQTEAADNAPFLEVEEKESIAFPKQRTILILQLLTLQILPHSCLLHARLLV